jgi:hypothetical protein
MSGALTGQPPGWETGMLTGLHVYVPGRALQRTTNPP